MQPIERRRVLRMLAGISAIPLAATIPPFSYPKGPALAAEQTPTKEAEPQKTFDVFGMHDAPFIGGSAAVHLAFSDWQRLGAKHVLAIDPSETFLARAKNSGQHVVSRLILSNNRYDSTKMEEFLAKVTAVLPNSIVQPFNEINLLSETEGVHLSAREHIRRDFLKAAELAADYGATTLLTPLAQRAEIDEFDLFRRMIEEIALRKSTGWIKKHIAVGAHAYIFEPGENPWKRVDQLQQIIVRQIGATLPIYITEIGLSQEHAVFSDKTFAEETVRLLKLDIPNTLRSTVKAACFWIYANKAQMPEVTGEPEDKIERFERSAWRDVRGPKQVFYAVEQLARAESVRTTQRT